MARKALLALACAGLMVGMLAAPVSAKESKKKFCDVVTRSVESPQELVKAAQQAARYGPGSLQDEIAVVEAAAKKAVKTGNPQDAFTPKVQRAINVVNAYAFPQCPASARAKVRAVNYAFKGMPTEMDTGTLAVRLSNRGDQEHEMSLARVKDGVTGTTREILDRAAATPEGSEPQDLEFVNGTGPVAPGKTGYFFAEMEPGRYVYVCFLGLGGQEGQLAHYTQGMFGELTVNEAA